MKPLVRQMPSRMKWSEIDTGIIVTEVDRFGIAINKRQLLDEYFIVVTKRRGALLPPPIRRLWEETFYNTRGDAQRAIRRAVRNLPGARFEL